MNYSNMIEEKNLKKVFIMATLISTVVGTFTASMALHDKITERIAKNKQKGIDSNQDSQLKELREKLEELQKAEKGRSSKGKDDKDKEDDKQADPKSDARSNVSRSQSRSGRGRSRRDSPMQEEDFAEAAKRSKDIIEQTYHDNVSQLGTQYAEGDLVTENALQAQVIQLQQTVIEVLQNAVASGQSLSSADFRRIANAQEIARDGSVAALNAQRDRLIAEQRAPVGKVVEEVPAAPQPSRSPPPRQNISAPSLEPVRKALPPLERAQERQWERRTEPDKSVSGGRKALPPAEAPEVMPWERQPELDRSSRKSIYREPVLASRGGSGSQAPQRTNSYRREELPPVKPREHYPDPFAAVALGAAAGAGAATVAGTVAGRSNAHRDGSPKNPSNTAAATVAGTIASHPKSHRDDHSTKSADTGAATVAGTKSGRSDSHRDEKPRKACSPAGTPDLHFDQRSSVREPLAREPWIPPADARRRSLAVQDPARIKIVWDEPRAVSKANSDPIRGAASERGPGPPPTQFGHQSPIKPSSVTSPPPSSSRRSARGSPPPAPTTLKALPAPAPPLFCRYSRDLQKNHSQTLDKAFSRSGDHRCPTCRVDIPVETRDVWVLSTHFPAHSRDPARQKARDYRMDARFVVKCHTADGRGRFACVLCDRFKDMDCICRDVDALVKHLGTAHTPDEFEGDPDLVRMKDGSIVNGKSGRELMLG